MAALKSQVMHVLFGVPEARADVQERWEKLGIRSTAIHPNGLLTLLTTGSIAHEMVSDAIVLLSEPLVPTAGTPEGTHAPLVANLPSQIRSLPEEIAMPDGRRWSAVPIVVLAKLPELELLTAFMAHLADAGFPDISVHEFSAADNFGAGVIKTAIKNYRQHILNELDNLGFIVTYEAGLYRLGPALKPHAERVGYYYFGPAAENLRHFITIDRDLVGIQLEVELLEGLLNNERASEADYQKFFEEHPHFLSGIANPLPHVQLRDSTGRLLVPDFILKPIVAAQRDSRWEVLDLKKPQAQLLAGRGSRRRLSQSVQAAIRQLRDYGDYFADTRNSDAVERTLGHRLRRPKLGVLIGRMSSIDIEALELEQARVPDVRIITYDEILQQQKLLVS
jgi:hypothetical protein